MQTLSMQSGIRTNEKEDHHIHHMQSVYEEFGSDGIACRFVLECVNHLPHGNRKFRKSRASSLPKSVAFENSDTNESNSVYDGKSENENRIWESVRGGDTDYTCARFLT